MRTFWIGDWRVEPDVNRIGRGEETRHVEPRAMDLLVYLADHAGEVISKDRLVRAVWPESFVTDGAVTYSINQLRQLLGDDARSPRFIETIPRRGYRLIAEVTSEEPADEESRYELLERLGQGGMGEVYLARDTILDRRVALKFLQPDKEKDELWLRRLMREARAAAALDHPYICKVYETGQLDGRDFIAMECLEGEKLSRRIERGPVPLEEALRIALEIAEALECAHTHGIVHRDIKPSNLILTGQGHVKITDFGIAKRFRRDEGEQEEGTLTDTAEASPGTPDYMSPEQIRGEPLDPRSDLFQFGMVLYEMLAGVHPFRGATKAETSAAILDREPGPLSELRADSSKRLERLLAKMLAKDADERFPSVREIKTELKEVLSGSAVARPSVLRRRLQVAGLGMLVILLILLGAVLWWQSEDLDISTAAHFKITPFTTEGGLKGFPRFSPDGERVAYDWDGLARDNRDIYVKALGAGAACIRLTDDPAEDRAPAWSPDGRLIAFTRTYPDGSGAIYLVPSLGGAERKLVDREGVPALDIGYLLALASWSPDGKTLIFSEATSPQGPARVVGISRDTLEKTVLTTPPQDTMGDLSPEFSPDGNQIAFVRVGSKMGLKNDVWVQSLADGIPHRLTELEAFGMPPPSWTTDGRSIVFTAFRTLSLSQLWRVEVGSRKLDPVAGPGQDVGAVDVWRSRLVFVDGQIPHRNVYRVSLTPDEGSTSELLIGSAYNDWNADVSPDGSRIVFESNRSGSNAIWLCGSDGSNPVQVTEFAEYCGTPRWSSDGKRVVFDSLHSGNWDLWIAHPKGGVPRQLTTDLSDENLGTWSRDGKWVYFTSTRTGRNEVFKIPSEGGKAVQLTQNGGWYALESPDGSYVYYTRNSSEPGLWRLPSNGQGEEEQVLPHVRASIFAVGKRGIYSAAFAPGDYRIQFYDLETRETRELHRRQGFFGHPGLTVSPDEKWLLFGEVPWPESELMLAENFR